MVAFLSPLFFRVFETLNKEKKNSRASTHRDLEQGKKKILEQLNSGLDR
jgi:hypothetical protein